MQLTRNIIQLISYGLVTSFLYGYIATASEPSAFPLITEIRFIGNETTKPEVIRYEMLVQEGSAADPKLIELSRQSIMNLGLFKSVKTRLTPIENGLLLEITVEEKFYILPLPRLDRNAEGDISYGAEITIDNLGGYNQKLKIINLTKEISNSDAVINSWSLDYSNPRIQGSPFRLDLFLRSKGEATINFDSSQLGENVYKHSSSNYGFTLSRWLKFTGLSQGWRAGAGFLRREAIYDFVSGDYNQYRSGESAAITTLVDYTLVNNFLYSRQGANYGYKGEYGSPQIGSDYLYFRHQFYYKRFYPVHDQPKHTTFNIQMKLGLYHDDTNGANPDSYAVGGSSTLRGYPRDGETGNAYFVTNLALYRPLFGNPALRGVLSMDIGDAYSDVLSMQPIGLKSTVGLGLRYKIVSLVKAQLVVDIGYHPADGNYKIYISTQDIF